MAIPIKNGVGVDKALVVRARVVARPVMVVTMKGRIGAVGVMKFFEIICFTPIRKGAAHPCLTTAHFF